MLASNVRLLELSEMINALKGRFCLLLGAGASASAGVPLANDFRNKLLRDFYREEIEVAETLFRNEYKELIQANPVTLEMVMQALKGRFGRSAFRIIQQHFDKKDLPPGYLDIALMIKLGYMQIVFSVNFDELLERAFDDILGPKEYELVCSSDDFASISPTINSEKPMLVKLHGTCSRPSTLVASWDEVQHLPPHKKDFFEFCLRELHPIVVGYSARDPDIREVFRNASRKKEDKKIFWVSRSMPSEPVREILDWYQSTGNHFEMQSDVFLKTLRYLLVEGHVYEVFRRLGYNNESSTTLTGKSGVSHTFSVVVRKENGERIAVDLLIGAKVFDETVVLAFFAKTFEASRMVTPILICVPGVNQTASDLARFYKINLVEAQTMREAAEKLAKSSLC